MEMFGWRIGGRARAAFLNGQHVAVLLTRNIPARLATNGIGIVQVPHCSTFSCLLFYGSFHLYAAIYKG
jgi:hypothetical protein